jgi:ethanolamine utilization protein EutN
MQLAKVVGHAVATVKHTSLHGWRLLVVQPLGVNNAADGEPILALDNLGAGPGHQVVVSSDGASARKMVGARNSPVRWMVMGVCD